ncbi:MAG TPA: DUF6541 family protein [Opitutaceae bacterium]|nr:DUF6541 family protein [Opitutaceae bacterium]
MPQISGTNNPADAYYNLLVDGLRAGQLNLKKEVPPGLKTLADPFDPSANAAYRTRGRLHDLSYYNGKLYLYFGITPALVLFWPYEALTHHYLFHKQAVAIFSMMGFIASVALLVAILRRYFPERGAGFAAAGALALGFATTVPAMVQRPDVYEVTISCAYAMVMLALLFLWQALHDQPRTDLWLALASLAFGLAVGARPNILFGAVILLIPLLRERPSASAQDERRWRTFTRSFFAAIGPLFMIGLGLLLYNYLRFGNPLEFGQHYQLSGRRRADLQNLFSLKYLWFNLRIYFLQPVYWSASFPFVKGFAAPGAPRGQLGVENVFGVLPNIPLVGMGLAAPLAWKSRAGSPGGSLRLFGIALFLLFLSSATVLCFFAGAAIRYEVDFVPVLVMLALLGVLGLERAVVAKPPWRLLVRCAWLALLFFSTTADLLISLHLGDN